MHQKGTLIDLETIGEFDRRYHHKDSRQYAQLQPTIFGYISENTLVQYCAEGPDEISNIIDIMSNTLPTFDPPFYALNCFFENGVCTHACNYPLDPMIDVRGGNSMEKKWGVRARLGIPTYNDPFNGNGYTCLLEWEKGNFKECMKHNRACLLIERDILERTKKIDAD
ncbi:MAG: hypothetical protein ACTSW1_05655 [Candidatus Hodarchaeales archaeon]